MKKQLMSTALVAAAFLSTTSALHAAAGYSDTFTGPLDPGWVEDRWLPANVTTTGGTLNLTLSNGESEANRPAPYNVSFYNYQGIQHAADVSGLWTFSSQIYVAPEVLTGAAGNRAASVWGRSEGAFGESSADYYIAGYTTVGGPKLQVWDSDMGGWNDILSPLTAGWHTIDMKYTGSSVDYYFDGSGIYSDTTLVDLLDPTDTRNASHFTTMFAQGKNFGDATTVPGGGDFTAPGSAVYKFDNMNAGISSVPDTGMTLGLLSLALCAMLPLHRKLITTS